MAVFFFVLMNLATKTPTQMPSDIPAINYAVISLSWLACMSIASKFGAGINPAENMARMYLFET
jgi:hypothetical protein